MEKLKLEIDDFEDKSGARGRYTRFDTSHGWMSCFKKDVCEELKDLVNKGEIEVAIKTVEREDGGEFTNILKVVKDDEEERPARKSRTRPEREVKSKTNNNNFREKAELSKQAGVATRYAVDLACHGKIEVSEIKTNAIIFHDFMKALAMPKAIKEEDD